MLVHEVVKVLQISYLRKLLLPPKVKTIEEQADRITFNRYTGVPGIISK